MTRAISPAPAAWAWRHARDWEEGAETEDRGGVSAYRFGAARRGRRRERACCWSQWRCTRCCARRLMRCRLSA